MKHFIAFPNKQTTKKVIKYSIYQIIDNIPFFTDIVKFDSTVNQTHKNMVITFLTHNECIEGMFDNYVLDMIE